MKLYEVILKIEPEKSDECSNFECKNVSCENCEYFCKKCSSCACLDELFEPQDKCFGCKYFCDECCSCTFMDDIDEDEIDDNDDYIDEEFELRKEIFKDYLKDTFKKIDEYANELFSEE